jgi:hypothetical protein
VYAGHRASLVPLDYWATSGASQSHQHSKRRAKVDLDEVLPNERQPRLGPKEDDELQRQIEANEGVFEPLLVEPHPEMPGKFRIIDGERRWTNSKALAARGREQFRRPFACDCRLGKKQSECDRAAGGTTLETYTITPDVDIVTWFAYTGAHLVYESELPLLSTLYTSKTPSVDFLIDKGAA